MVLETVFDYSKSKKWSYTTLFWILSLFETQKYILFVLKANTCWTSSVFKVIQSNSQTLELCVFGYNVPHIPTHDSPSRQIWHAQPQAHSQGMMGLTYQCEFISDMTHLKHHTHTPTHCSHCQWLFISDAHRSHTFLHMQSLTHVRSHVRTDTLASWLSSFDSGFTADILVSALSALSLHIWPVCWSVTICHIDEHSVKQVEIKFMRHQHPEIPAMSSSSETSSH